MVRAKFRCITMTQHESARAFKFAPVYAPAAEPNHENHKFWLATPSGELNMFLTNPETFDKFEVGKEYYLDFSVAT